MSLATTAAVVSVAGGVKGLLDDGGGGQASASREPWGPAQPWLKDQIARGQELQRFYEQNPFSPQSMTAYQNIFNDLDSMRSGLIPNILNLSGNIMRGGYQVPQLSRPGTAGYGGMQQPASASPRDAVGEEFSVLRAPSSQPAPATQPAVTAQPAQPQMIQYFRQNPDVAAAYQQDSMGMSPDEFAQTHYRLHGQREKRASPNGAIGGSMYGAVDFNQFRNMGQAPRPAQQQMTAAAAPLGLLDLINSGDQAEIARRMEQNRQIGY